MIRMLGKVKEQKKWAFAEIACWAISGELLMQIGALSHQHLIGAEKESSRRNCQSATQPSNNPPSG